MQNYCMRRLSSVFPWVQNENLEDAAAEAVVWGMTMWAKVPSSVTPDLAKNFKGAKWACSRKAAEFAWKLYCKAPEADLPEPEPDPLLERAAAVVDVLEADEREWTSWARDFLAGKTTRETGREAGVSHVAIVKRRNRGLERIRPLLEKHGLVPEGGTT